MQDSNFQTSPGGWSGGEADLGGVGHEGAPALTRGPIEVAVAVAVEVAVVAPRLVVGAVPGPITRLADRRPVFFFIFKCSNIQMVNEGVHVFKGLYRYE
jgi:hypothetical protein